MGWLNVKFIKLNNMQEKQINVASKESTTGHFATGAKKVVMLDKITPENF